MSVVSGVAVCNSDTLDTSSFLIRSQNGSAVMMSGKACLSGMFLLNYPEAMPQVSFNSPFYFFTSVTHHRLPIFSTDKMKDVLCRAFNEARSSSGMLFFAYVVMPDHFHFITDNKRSPSDSLRYLNGVTARRVIDYLKNNNYSSSLDKLRQEKKKDGYQYSVWEHHSDKFLLTSESLLMQKVNYINQNPVADGLVEVAEDYKYSSARIWRGAPLEDEPLAMNVDQIKWRTS